MGLFDNTSYISVEDAEEYFEGRLVTTAWDDATDALKSKALIEATKRIDRLNYAGLRTSDYNRRKAESANGTCLVDNIIQPTDIGTDPQAHEFPRDGRTDIPVEVLSACCEIAYALLDGVDAEMELINLGTSSQGFAAIRETYDPMTVNLAFRHGIPSVTAWNYLRPFLKDPSEIRIRRA